MILQIPSVVNEWKVTYNQKGSLEMMTEKCQAHIGYKIPDGSAVVELLLHHHGKEKKKKKDLAIKDYLIPDSPY